VIATAGHNITAQHQGAIPGRSTSAQHQGATGKRHIGSNAMIEVYTANTPNGVKLPSRLKTTKHTCLAARA
jgi:hypothetical protein